MITKTQSTHVRIKAEFGYYPGTFYAPQDGYLMDLPAYDSFTGKETNQPLEFDSVADAFSYLTNCDEYDQDARFCEHDGNGKFSCAGTYLCHHGQYSRPVYTIVSAKSGRCNKSIIAECDAIATRRNSPAV